MKLQKKGVAQMNKTKYANTSTFIGALLGFMLFSTFGSFQFIPGGASAGWLIGTAIDAFNQEKKATCTANYVKSDGYRTTYRGFKG
jgi:hypothetical protein